MFSTFAQNKSIFLRFLFFLILIKIIGKEEEFKHFYLKYFQSFMDYETVTITTKRLAFIFQYLKIRNIGDLDLENNTQIDCIDGKKLTSLEKKEIVSFFIKTIKELHMFDEYIKKGNDATSDFKKDRLYKLFMQMRKELKALPQAEEMSREYEDFTFLIKDVPFLEREIQLNVSADTHSSPEYFSMEYKKLSKEMHTTLFQKESLDLEALFKNIQHQLEKRAVSFFCGDLDDRDRLHFLDAQDTGCKKEYGDRTNFLRYNFFKDFYHTVHAAYQLYCLHNNNIENITRFQVFGNHETEIMNKRADKKRSCDYFSSIISSVRRFILPTELNLLLKNGNICILRHGFFPQSMKKELHCSKKITKEFKVFYQKKNPVVNCGQRNSSIIRAPYFFHSGYAMNPVLWSDMYNTDEKLDLDEKISGIYDARKSFFDFTNGRGFYNTVSWKRGVLEGKRISIDNFIFFNEDTFLSNEEIKVLKKSKPTLICGHSHTSQSLQYGLLKRNNMVSFHPYYFEDNDFLFHFCLCSHHNLFVEIYKAIFNRYKNEMRQKIILDWSNDTPVHILSTVYGKKWLNEWNERILKKSR